MRKAVFILLLSIASVISAINGAIYIFRGDFQRGEIMILMSLVFGIKSDLIKLQKE